MLCILAAMAPFILPRIPVGTDLPKHVLVARVLGSYNQAKYGYANHFDIDLAPRPTILGELALAGLAKVLDPFDAAKAYLALFIAGLWLAGRFLAVRGGQPALAALLLLPLAHSWPVFAALLPFIVTIPLFALLLGVLTGQPRGLARSAWICLLLLLLYGFHIVGLVAGCFAVVLFAFDRKERWQVAWSDLLALVPAACLAGRFLLHDRGSSGHWLYSSPLGQFKVYLGYNAWTLSRVAGILFIGLAAALAAWVAWQAYRQRQRPRLLFLAAAMAVAGLLLPVQIADWFVVGSRTFPFVVVASLGFLRFSHRGVRIMAVVVFGFLAVSAFFNTRAALHVQDEYRVFLSGMPAVNYGARILPIIEDPTTGNASVQPFWGIEDAYNIYRGGSSPYNFSTPNIRTGAAFLHSHYGLDYAFRSSDVTPAYSGVSRKYDYVVLYGKLPGVRRALAEEMCLSFSNGPLSIFGSCHGAGAPAAGATAPPRPRKPGD